MNLLRRSGRPAGFPVHTRSGRIAAGAAVGFLLIGGGVAAGVVSRDGTPTAGQAAAAATAPAARPTTVTAGPVDTTGFPHGSTGIFTDTCKRTAVAANDPILMPGMPGKSMQHDFFGNTATTASSTPSSLVGGSSSCSTSADASAYWSPVLYQNGKAVHPNSTLIYWRAPKPQTSSVQTMPVGLTMIAGNEKSSTPQGIDVVKWMCAQDLTRASATPQTCTDGHDLRLVITFPSCWDGHTLDGAAQTNVVYPSGGDQGACPASHPVRIPQVVFHANYATASASGLTLSIGPDNTGPITTEHADFMNGWRQSLFTADVKACIVADVRCGQVRGDAATPKGGATDAQRAMRRKQGGGGKTNRKNGATRNGMRKHDRLRAAAGSGSGGATPGTAVPAGH